VAVAYFEALLCISDVVGVDVVSGGFSAESLTALPATAAAAASLTADTSLTTVSADSPADDGISSSPTLNTGLNLSEKPSDVAAAQLLLSAVAGSMTASLCATDRNTEICQQLTTNIQFITHSLTMGTGGVPVEQSL